MYISILLGFSITSRIVSTFSGKSGFFASKHGLCMINIGVLEFLIWAHHTFVMGDLIGSPSYTLFNSFEFLSYFGNMFDQGRVFYIQYKFGELNSFDSDLVFVLKKYHLNYINLGPNNFKMLDP